MRTKFLLLVLALQSAWVIGTTIVQESKLRFGQVVLLECGRVDPRDPLRGDYLILNYKISDISTELISPPLPTNLASGAVIYVALAQHGKFHEAVRASANPLTPTSGEVILRGKNEWRWEGNGWHPSVHLTYDLERYYVHEGTGNPDGKLTVQVAISKSGRALIKQVFVDDIPYAEAMKLPADSPKRKAARARAQAETSSPQIVLTHTNLPLAGVQIKPDEEAALRALLDQQRKQFGGDSTNAASAAADLASCLLKTGKPAEAEQLARESLAVQRKLLGDDHLFVANALGVLSSALRDQGKLAEAETTRRENLAIRRKALSNEDPRVATSLDALGSILQRESKLAEAEVSFREALAIRRKISGAQSPQVRDTLARLNEVLKLEGKPPE